MFAIVAIVHVLDHFLAILMREIDVDVGDLVALFGEEAFEEQVHADRIDRRDAERVTHRGVGGRTTPLAEHAELPRGARDVPHHEKITREIHARDDPEFVFELPFHVRGEWPAIAFVRAAHHERAQIAMRARLLGGNRKERELAGELVEPERAPFRDRERVRKCRRIRREDPRHLRRALEIEFVIGQQQRARFRQVRAVLHARQHVAEQRVAAFGVGDAVRGDARQFEFAGERGLRVDEPRVFGP